MCGRHLSAFAEGRTRFLSQDLNLRAQSAKGGLVHLVRKARSVEIYMRTNIKDGWSLPEGWTVRVE